MKKISYVFLMILMLAFFVQGVYVFSSTLTFTLIQKMMIISIQTISVIGFTYFYTIDMKKEKKSKYIRGAHVIIFIMYVVNLGYVLLFDPDFGRSAGALNEFNHINLELFSTIRLFVRGYQLGRLSIQSIFINIVGNLVLFMPMAYFCPLFFQKQRKWYVFAITIIFIVLAVEVIQVLIQTGTGDIDDWFLNVSGAMIMYTILKLCKIQKVYEKLG